MSTPEARSGGAEDSGQMIAAARKARGLTQSELARQTAISLSLLRKIERGSRSLTPGVRGALDAVLAPVPASVGNAAGPERITAVFPQLSGMPDEAVDRMAEAQAIARQVPDGVYHGTAFGPGSVRVHELALAVEAGDVARAVKLAGQWQPSPALPAERRSHFYIEAARAYCWAGNRDRAVTALWHARRAAPQHTRCNPAVIETIGVLIRGSRKPPPPLIQLATWIVQP